MRCPCVVSEMYQDLFRLPVLEEEGSPCCPCVVGEMYQDHFRLPVLEEEADCDCDIQIRIARAGMGTSDELPNGLTKYAGNVRWLQTSDLGEWQRVQIDCGCSKDGMLSCEFPLSVDLSLYTD
ncbi:hypothetical protein Tco_0598236 [Tanacetum coccineum]